MTETKHLYNNASDELKLAIDIIYLLEANNIDINTALKAINIVKKDLDKKLTTTTDSQIKNSPHRAG